MGQVLCLTRNYCTHVLTQDLAHGRVGCLCLEYIAQAEAITPTPRQFLLRVRARALVQ